MISLTLPEDVETRLKQCAASLGIAPDEYARRLIIDQLPSATQISPQELFAQWEAEDPVIDADDLSRRNQEVDELCAALNRNRLESEGPGARLPCPSR